MGCIRRWEGGQGGALGRGGGRVGGVRLGARCPAAWAAEDFRARVPARGVACCRRQGVASAAEVNRGRAQPPAGDRQLAATLHAGRDGGAMGKGRAGPTPPRAVGPGGVGGRATPAGGDGHRRGPTAPSRPGAKSPTDRGQGGGDRARPEAAIDALGSPGPGWGGAGAGGGRRGRGGGRSEGGRGTPAPRWRGRGADRIARKTLARGAAS